MRLPIETERLLLRKFETGDAEDIVNYSADADSWLSRNLDWEPTEESVKAYYESRRDVTPDSRPEWLDLVVVLKSTGQVVGNVGIGVTHAEQGMASAGWLLGRRHRGRGIATEAVTALLGFGFEAMGLHRISARTGMRNERSWRLMERIGMTREAHLRQSHQVAGEWDDEFVYAALGNEWVPRRRDRSRRRAMRYGLQARDRLRPPGAAAFHAQSSVLDEEDLLEHVLGLYRIPEAKGCRFYCRGDSDIYQVTTATERFYLKIYRPPHSLGRAEAEARFVTDLASNGVPVVRAVPRTDGVFATEVRASEGRRPALLFEEAPQAAIAVDRAEECRRLGRAVAELHEAADALESSHDLITHDCDAVVNGYLRFARRLIPEDDFRYLEDLMARIRHELHDLSREPPDFGYCHSDLVPSNIRQTEDGRITFFDFGGASRTWRSWELAVLHLCLGKNERGQDALVEGYSEVRSLPERFEEVRPLYLLLRRVSWLGGVLASCPLRLGVQDFGPEFVNGRLDDIRALEAGIAWKEAGHDS